jgi:hypothetical protein
LGKKFIKKDSRSKDRVPGNTEEIDNSLRGLFNYLTAPNIRSKIKHPLFIKMYLRHKDFDTENQEELIKIIHETVASSVETKNEVIQTENTKICL